MANYEISAGSENFAYIIIVRKGTQLVVDALVCGTEHFPYFVVSQVLKHHACVMSSAYLYRRLVEEAYLVL